MAIIVEERDASELMRRGAAAGVAAGLVLGAVEILVGLLMEGSAALPFRFVSALVFGPRAFEPGFPLALVVLVGAAVHLALAALFGVLFLALLAWTYQLSARAGLLLLWGAAFGFLLWEVNFLAVLPSFFPDVAERFGPVNQLVNGIVAYTLFYGAVLGAYQAYARAGVRTRWVT